MEEGKRFDSLDKRVYDLHGRIEQVAGDVKTLAADIRSLDERLSGLAIDVRAIRKQTWMFITAVLVAPIVGEFVKLFF